MDWLDWSFWQWLGAALALVVTAIGIKFAFTFDLNRYLERRREREEERLKALCSHTRVRVSKSGEVFFAPNFHRPPMTYSWRCNQCGVVVNSKETVERIARNWASDPDGWKKTEKRFEKARKKFYGL